MKMHSSLSAIGDVEGGAENLLDILIEYFTAKGGLFCVPTHTWLNVVNKEITLDINSNDHCLGAFSTIALKSGRGIRFENPTHSLVAFGVRDKAKEFIKNQLKELNVAKDKPVIVQLDEEMAQLIKDKKVKYMTMREEYDYMKENLQLKKQLAELQKENDFLKKAAAFFAKEID